MSLLSTLKSFALNVPPVGVSNVPQIDQYSITLNFSISVSLSQIIFKATDWTLPAEIVEPPDCSIIAFQRNGLILYPIILSITLLARCDETNASSIFLGCCIA